MTPLDIETLSTLAMDAMDLGVYVVDTNRKILLWNKKAEEITGFSRSEVIGLHCHEDFLRHIDRDATPLCLTNCPIHATIEDGQRRGPLEVYLRHKEGYRVAVEVVSNPLYQEDELIGVVETFGTTDATFYSDDLVDSLTRLVMTDKLTGLYNRRHAENVIHTKLNETRFSAKYVGILFIDLDDFSRCNNEYGHDVGDLILQEVANRVSEQIRKTDLFSRWGGEEFLGVFDLEYAGQVAALGEKIRKIIEGIYLTVKEERVQVTASIGATVLQSGDNLDSVISRADKLMYESKKSGKNQVTVG